MESEAERKLRQLSPDSNYVPGIQYCTWQRGTNITVRVYSEYLHIEPSTGTFEWAGKIQILNFDVTVMKDAPVGESIQLKYDVTIAGFIVARLRIDMKIVESPGSLILRQIGKRPYRTAFASYASKDRSRVLDRVSEIVRNGIDVFLDCLDLHPGELWKERLKKEITQRETFMLFWSLSAKNSQWVEWEWKTAFNNRGGVSGIDPHPLEDPSLIEPPEELKPLHFDDIYMIIRRAYV